MQPCNYIWHIKSLNEIGSPIFVLYIGVSNSNIYRLFISLSYTTSCILMEEKQEVNKTKSLFVVYETEFAVKRAL